MAKQSLSLECRCKVQSHNPHPDFDETAPRVCIKPVRWRRGCDQVPVSGLLLAAKRSGTFAQQLVLLRPARLERPSEDVLEIIAVIDGGVQKNDARALFRPAHFFLPRWVTIERHGNG